MQGERCLARDCFEQDDAPLPVAPWNRVRGKRHPAESPTAQDERSDYQHIHTRSKIEFPNRLRQTRIVADVLDALAPSLRVAEKMSRHAVARHRQRVPIDALWRVQPI